MDDIDRQIRNIIHSLPYSRSTVAVFGDRWDHDFRYENGFDPHDHIRALISAAVEVGKRFSIDPEWMKKYLSYKIEHDDENPSYPFFSHDESEPSSHPEAIKASGQPPTTPQGEGKTTVYRLSSPSPSVFSGSSGDTYEYYPERRDYE